MLDDGRIVTLGSIGFPLSSTGTETARMDVPVPCCETTFETKTVYPLLPSQDMWHSWLLLV